GRLDILVNAAHVTPSQNLLEMDEWDWRRTVDVNLTGAFFAAQLCARVMADEGGGLIFLLTNRPSGPITAGQGAWQASQAGMGMLAVSLQIETANQNVRVTEVAVSSPEVAAAGVLDLVRNLT